MIRHFRHILILFNTVTSLCYAAPTSINDDAEAKIIRFENFNDGSGNYYFSYETSNGIIREEKGTLVKSGQPDAHIEVQGTFTYTHPNGELKSIAYTADENGYQIIAPKEDAQFMIPVKFEVAAFRSGRRSEIPSAIVNTLLGSGG